MLGLEPLTHTENERLFETGSLKPEWHVATCAALLMAKTSMRPRELKRLLWQDLDPINGLILVRRSKTEAGTRVIPLNDEAWSAICALKNRAEGFGTGQPEHFIFHRLWPTVDANRPLRSWQSA